MELQIIAALSVGFGFLATTIWRAAIYIGNRKNRREISQEVAIKKAAEDAEYNRQILDRLSLSMDENDRVHEMLIEQLQDLKIDDLRKSSQKIFNELNKMSDNQLLQAMNIVKGIAYTDTNPVLIYKTSPGKYELIWINPAWTEWTGLNLEESASGGDLLAVEEEEREVLGPSIFETGQSKGVIDVKYTLIKPKTHEIVGRVWAYGYPMNVDREDAWYYVSRLRKVEDKDA